MNPKQKAEQIDRLAEAIGYVATDFERFGALFLDALLEIPMTSGDQSARLPDH